MNLKTIRLLPWEFLDCSKRRRGNPGGKLLTARVDEMEMRNQENESSYSLQRRSQRSTEFLPQQSTDQHILWWTNQGKSHLKGLKKTVPSTQRKWCPFPKARLEETSNSHPLLINIVLEILASVLRQETKVI